MKALSLTQPWATLLVGGRKRWETRSWQRSYRGPLLIHAAKTFATADRELCEQEPFRWALRCLGVRSAADLPLGAVIGGARLETVLPIPSRTVLERGAVEVPPGEPERSFGNYTPGRYAWLFSRPRSCEPIDASGHLGLWQFDDLRGFASRILTRVVNVRWLAPYDVYVGRRNARWGLAESPFHNPFRIGADGDLCEVLGQYLTYLQKHPDLVARAATELRGMTLSCWCAPELCHADMLAMLANGLSLDEVRGRGRKPQELQPWV